MLDNYYFFDTSAFLWVFRRQQHTNEKGNLHWDILNEITSGRPTFGYSRFIASDLMEQETIKVLNQKKESELNIAKFQVEFQSFKIINRSESIEQESFVLMKKYGLESHDAIHLASALEARNVYGNVVFLTYDKKLEEAAVAEGFKVNVID